ncbi:MAG TPA: TetR/AcrR family transcriptional regulator [Lichenihabitans sp.]|jgi:AcrR family transcriptional regulator|nr:TetR/AcrR family transcriptional regulator [Lichenihabitans sp.]
MSSRAGPAARSYHHGDLRHALIATAESLLAEKGVESFTLRECARRAGVSPAAPAHHFGNMTGLLTAIATLGFNELAARMDDALAASDGTPEGRLKAIGLGYVRFALAYPGRFRVIFGRFPLAREDAAFAAASRRAFDILARTIAAQPAHVGRAGPAAEADLVLAWSTVHGFANLALDGQMPFVEGADRGAAVEAMAARVIGLMSAAVARRA